MFLLIVLYFLSGCSKDLDLKKKVYLNCDKIEIRGNLTDAFTIEWFSKIEHSVINSLEEESIVIKVLQSKYSYQENKLKVLDLAIYQINKISGFRVVFSNLEDQGDLPNKIANWIINFLKDKFGTIELSEKVLENNKLKDKIDNQIDKDILNKEDKDIEEVKNQENLLDTKTEEIINKEKKESILNKKTMEEEIEASSADDNYNKLRIE